MIFASLKGRRYALRRRVGNDIIMHAFSTATGVQEFPIGRCIKKSLGLIAVNERALISRELWSHEKPFRERDQLNNHPRSFKSTRGGLISPCEYRSRYRECFRSSTIVDLRFKKKGKDKKFIFNSFLNTYMLYIIEKLKESKNKDAISCSPLENYVESINYSNI